MVCGDAPPLRRATIIEFFHGGIEADPHTDGRKSHVVRVTGGILNIMEVQPYQRIFPHLDPETGYDAKFYEDYQRMKEISRFSLEGALTQYAGMADKNAPVLPFTYSGASFLPFLKDHDREQMNASPWWKRHLFISDAVEHAAKTYQTFMAHATTNVAIKVRLIGHYNFEDENFECELITLNPTN